MSTDATVIDYALEHALRKRFDGPLIGGIYTDDLYLEALRLEVEARNLLHRIDESIARCDAILTGIEAARAKLGD